jgi:hypothetical protein
MKNITKIHENAVHMKALKRTGRMQIFQSIIHKVDLTSIEGWISVHFTTHPIGVTYIRAE